jgi:uncharacterized protein HemX
MSSASFSQSPPSAFSSSPTHFQTEQAASQSTTHSTATTLFVTIAVAVAVTVTAVLAAFFLKRKSK